MLSSNEEDNLISVSFFFSMLAYCFAIFKLWVTLQMWFCVFVTRWCCCRTLWNDICGFFFFF